MAVETRRMRARGAGQAWPPPRRDGTALGFGLAFLVLGIAASAQSAGLRLDPHWLNPLILICLGAAGLASVLSQRRRND